MITFGAGLRIKPIVNSTPSIFNIMRLSSVTLIAAALSSIADSVIAAPRPFHARALEDVNSFSERDVQVDVHSRKSGLALLEREVDDEFGDDLFIRTTHSEAAAARASASTASKEASTKARLAADKAEEAAKKAKEAADKAHKIGKPTSDHDWYAAHYKYQVSFHGQRADGHDNDATQHTKMAGNKSNPNRSKKTAENSITEATASSCESDQAIAGYEDFIAKMGHIIGGYDSHRRHLAEQYDSHRRHLAEQYESHRRHDAAQALRDLKEGGR